MNQRRCDSASCSALYVTYRTESSPSPSFDPSKMSAPLIYERIDVVVEPVTAVPSSEEADESQLVHRAVAAPSTARCRIHPRRFPCEHQPRNQRRRLLLHGGDRVRVGIQGDRDGGVPEALGNNLRVNAGAQRQRRWVCRMACRRMVGNAALFTAWRKKRLTTSGCIASPSSRVKIKPVSVQLLAVACSTS